MNAQPVLCPSSRCETGALLLGIVLPDGRVAFASDRIVVDEDFAQAAQEGGAPEQRFRFGGLCVKGGCKQWTGQRCGVIDKVMEDVPADARTDELPECSIREQCRWFEQSGGAACAVCPLVITDSRELVEDEEGQLARISAEN